MSVVRLSRRWLFGVIGAGALLVAGCSDDGGGSGSDADSGTTAPANTSDTTTDSADTTAPDTTTPDTTTPGTALGHDGTTYTINWGAISPPFFATPSAGSADPFYHIHSDGADDGFFFSLELYTTGYGALWTGELGTFPLGCSEAAPAPNSTGICVHFDPDGPGGVSDLNADFAATGSITINQLDASGYSIDVGQIMFSNGSVVAPFTMTG